MIEAFNKLAWSLTSLTRTVSGMPPPYSNILLDHLQAILADTEALAIEISMAEELAVNGCAAPVKAADHHPDYPPLPHVDRLTSDCWLMSWCPTPDQWAELARQIEATNERKKIHPSWPLTPPPASPHSPIAGKEEPH